MEIIITRIHTSEHSIDGYLCVNHEKICDTAECRTTALPKGDYPIRMVKCKQYKRRCLCIGQQPDCAACPLKRTDMVWANTLMPRVCPMLKIGNGVRGRTDGSIIVGQRIGTEVPVWGSLIKSHKPYDKLFERIRKQLIRRNKVILRIL